MIKSALYIALSLVLFSCGSPLGTDDEVKKTPTDPDIIEPQLIVISDFFGPD